MATRLSDLSEQSQQSMTTRDNIIPRSSSSANQPGTSTLPDRKPHGADGSRWEAIQAIRTRDGYFAPKHFKMVKQIGEGDVGKVFLCELCGTGLSFAMKVMDTEYLTSRGKLGNVQNEIEILQMLDHPFLPTLYCYFETGKFAASVMEYCPGGDLHDLLQQQTGKRFQEQAARFYAAEVLLGLEYLHVLGVVYRDLKPENILIREDGHILISDFDVSMRTSVSPTIVRSTNSGQIEPSNIRLEYVGHGPPNSSCRSEEEGQRVCLQPLCFATSMFGKKASKKEKPKKVGGRRRIGSYVPELQAEPSSAVSMSFVGTPEYLAPEIIKGEGHGSAVDWWTFGIFLYELLFGTTPFQISGNCPATIYQNVLEQPLSFPGHPTVSLAARQLIEGLLVKIPQQRLAYKRGATEIKRHRFFEGINWALVRSTTPPFIPTSEAL